MTQSAKNGEPEQVRLYEAELSNGTKTRFKLTPSDAKARMEADPGLTLTEASGRMASDDVRERAEKAEKARTAAANKSRTAETK